MPNELDVQSEFQKAVKAGGGYAFKTSNRFLSGIPDMFVALPPWPVMLIEWKKIETPKRKGTLIEVALTPLQREKMKILGLAGAVCGWVLAVRGRAGYYGLLAGAPGTKLLWGQEEAERSVFAKLPGAHWPIHPVIGAVKKEWERMRTKNFEQEDS